MSSTAPNRALGKLLISLCTPKITPIMEYCLKFDGCSKGNPGPAGAGAVIYKNDQEIWANSKYVGDKETNNVAEYHGLIMGLSRANELGIKELLVMGDSELIIKQMKGEYKVKSVNIIEHYLKAKTLSRLFDNIKYEHIYRKDNTRADELANLGLQCNMN
uniref:RNase H type-1 domain-containing protein n=1 Tax=viral metagenome TaxID=1070528 RepID=A0A6C0DKZ1_9ZZZZ